MIPFRVGDRVRCKFDGIVATVTAITARGFKWRLDEPRSMGPRFGWYQEGESYMPDQYELVEHAPPINEVR